MNTRQLNYRVEFTGDGRASPRIITSRRDFGLESKDVSNYFNSELPPRLVDLLRVGEAAFVVDRLVRRRRGPSRRWGRELRVRVELLAPFFWRRPEVLDLLRRTLEFVSGDSWDFDFVTGSAGYERTRPLLGSVLPEEPPLVCLYSGGLDSAAGLALRQWQSRAA